MLALRLVFCVQCTPNRCCRKNTVFWDVTPCRSCVNRRFGGTYRLHLQGRKIREQGTSVKMEAISSSETSVHTRSTRRQSAATCSRWFLASGFFYPEDGGDMFLRNVGSHKICTAPHPRRRHSSQSPLRKSQILQVLS
jgi:hypothetical protein